MKRLTQVLGASLVLFAMIQAEGWAQEKYVPKANEELYGTWTNERYPKSDPYHVQKVVIAADRYELYFGKSDSVKFANSNWEIEAKWTDSEGNIWYKTFGTHTDGMFDGYRWQEIDKLSKSGTVWERQLNPIAGGDFSPNYYPTKIDPESYYYRILYRDQK